MRKQCLSLRGCAEADTDKVQEASRGARGTDEETRPPELPTIGLEKIFPTQYLEVLRQTRSSGERRVQEKIYENVLTGTWRTEASIGETLLPLRFIRSLSATSVLPVTGRGAGTNVMAPLTAGSSPKCM